MTTPIDELAAVAQMDGPNTHKMDAPSNVTNWTVIPTTREVPSDDGRRMESRDEWWHVPTFVVEAIESAARSTPVPASNVSEPGPDHPFGPDREDGLPTMAGLVPIPASNVSKCVACFEPSHDIDHHDHHYHPLDATTYIGEAHPSVPASNVSEGLLQTLTRFEDDESIHSDDGIFDVTVADLRAALAHAAPEGLDVERLERAIAESPVARTTWQDCRVHIDAVAAEYARLSLAHAAPEGLDVERLARALEAEWMDRQANPPHWDDDTDVWAWRAKGIAAEYRRLSQPDATEEAGRPTEYDADHRALPDPILSEPRDA